MLLLKIKDFFRCINDILRGRDDKLMISVMSNVNILKVILVIIFF